MKRHLVIGCRGEVGAAVLALLREQHDAQGIDLGDRLAGRFDVLHICIRWTGCFESVVRAYQELYGGADALMVIHSTVPLGACDALGAVHSPVRGVHPNLAESLKAFVKYFGGPRAREAAEDFMQCGVSVNWTQDARNTEALKLWCTTGYGLNIILEKAIWEYCAEHALDFDLVYHAANDSYNLGFWELGRPGIAKYNLKHVPGPIGGHCVLPNCDLLGGAIAEFVKAGSARMAGV